MWLGIGAIIDLIIKYLGANAGALALKIVFVSSVLTLIVTVLTVAFNQLTASLVSIQAQIPSIVLDVWGWVMPANSAQCLFVLISVSFLRRYMDLKIQILNNRMQVLSQR